MSLEEIRVGGSFHRVIEGLGWACKSKGDRDFSSSGLGCDNLGSSGGFVDKGDC